MKKEPYIRAATKTRERLVEIEKNITRLLKFRYKNPAVIEELLQNNYQQKA